MLGEVKRLVVLNGIMSIPIVCNLKLKDIIEILVLYISSVGASGVVLELNFYLTNQITKLPEYYTFDLADIPENIMFMFVQGISWE